MPRGPWGEPSLVARLAILPRTNRAAVPGLIALLAAVTIAIIHLRTWAHGHVSGFIVLGRQFVNPAQLPHGLYINPNAPHSGNDSQFFYRLALDPANLHPTAFGITIDRPYRYTRIGYPVLAWLVSLGQHQAVPVALVAINIAGIACLGVLGGMFARQAGRHALCGLLMPAYFGLVISLTRDFAEPLADACLLAGMLAYRRRRFVLAAAAFTYGGLTRETVLVVPAAIAMTRVLQIARRRARPANEDLAWAVPMAVYGTWQIVVLAVTGALPIRSNASYALDVPFVPAIQAVLTALRYATADPQLEAWLMELAVLLVLAVVALLSLRTTSAPLHERLAFVIYLAGMSVVTSATWTDYSDNFRSFIEVYLLSLIILFGAPVWVRASASVSPGG
jgi:hypothetical protein